MTYIHPFDDPLVMAGQGTIGQEVVEQLPRVTHIFVPVGGGGLIAGIASYVKAIRPDVKIISVEPSDSNAMQESIRRKKRINLEYVGIFADGVAVKQVGEKTLAVASVCVDDFITVTTDQVCAAIKDIYEATRGVVEPAGALAVAAINQYGLPPGAHAVAICSGANVAFERLQQIAERTLVGSHKEALIAVSLREQPGALSAFCRNIVKDRNITELSYRLNRRDKAWVLLGIGVEDAADRKVLVDRVSGEGYECADLSENDITKEHVRRMIGGEATQVKEERFFHIDFSERSGALANFLEALGDKWNISLFHYRFAASDIGRVLIGFETGGDTRALMDSLDKTGFNYEDVSLDEAIAIFC